MKKGSQIPNPTEIMKLTTYLKDSELQRSNNLKSAINSGTWPQLREVTLADVIVFNTRRMGEVQRLSVSDINSRSKKTSSR